MDKSNVMKYKDWLRLIRKHPCKDLNGKVIAYLYGKPIGEIVYKEGIVISLKEFKKTDRKNESGITRETISKISKII